MELDQAASAMLVASVQILNARCASMVPLQSAAAAIMQDALFKAVIVSSFQTMMPQIVPGICGLDAKLENKAKQKSKIRPDSTLMFGLCQCQDPWRARMHMKSCP